MRSGGAVLLGGSGICLSSSNSSSTNQSSPWPLDFELRDESEFWRVMVAQALVRDLDSMAVLVDGGSSGFSMEWQTSRPESRLYRRMEKLRLLRSCMRR